MRLAIDVRLDYAFPEPADVLLQVEVSADADQRLIEDRLVVESDHPIRAVPGEGGVGQRCLAHARDRLVASYHAVVDIDRPAIDLAALPATPVHALPAEAIPYLLPSLYCPATTFEPFVRHTFCDRAGGALATALVDWVAGHLRYAAATSSGETTALDTFMRREGVCRDYAHLIVALARAAAIPARCVAVYAPGVDPPDFHAVAELWLAGGWHLVDATRMADCGTMARVAVGRDAADIAFMTVFGTATLTEQRVLVVRA